MTCENTTGGMRRKVSYHDSRFVTVTNGGGEKGAKMFWNSSKINGALFEEGKSGQKAQLRHLLDKSSL